MSLNGSWLDFSKVVEIKSRIWEKLLVYRTPFIREQI
jgi:hypothetical protein